MNTLINQSLISSQTGNWDLIKDGKSLISFQSFISISEEMSAQTVSQAIEENGYMSVNKVCSPNKYSVCLALQGLEYELTHALNILENELNSASLVQIVTPYGVTPQSTIVSKKITREAKKGIGLIIVDLSLVQISLISQSHEANTYITSDNSLRASDVSFIDFGLQAVKLVSSAFSKLF